MEPNVGNQLQVYGRKQWVSGNSIVKLDIPNRVAVIPMSLISISNGIVVPPLGPIRLMLAMKDRFSSGTISGAFRLTVAPKEKYLTIGLHQCGR